MIDNTSISRDIKSSKSVRLHYENDFFSTTDKYYTQGINLEIYHTAVGKILPSLLRQKNRLLKQGVALEHLGFTPTSISSSQILINDRPFASCLMGKVFSVSQHASKQERIASTISVGVIGPLAGGREFQSAIHRWINDQQPKGWEHQIRNDFVMNVDISLDRGIISSRNFAIIGKGVVSVGTLTTKMKLGSTVMAGWYEDVWSTVLDHNNKFRIYFYTTPTVAVVGYDATLQGGLFNRNSPYKISADDIKLFVFQNDAAFVFKINSLYLEYFQSFITAEFRQGANHRWGGIRVAKRF